jgi:hypothetical protein
MKNKTMHHSRTGNAWRSMLGALGVAALLSSNSPLAAQEVDPYRLSDQPTPLQIEDDPPRPMMLFHLGESFQHTGQLQEGITIPTGAVWHPALWVFGTYRTAVQTFNGGSETTGEWANRFDLFSHLRLSGTEHAVLSLRPVDQQSLFTGYYWEPEGNPEGWQSEFNVELGNMFFEGEIGQLIPALGTDIAFSIGKQPLVFQEGMLINDVLYGVGIAKNSLHPFGLSNLMVSLLYGWDQINRETGEDNSAQLVSLFTEADASYGTVNANLIYLMADDATGDGLYAGLSSIQRLGRFNTAFYANASITLGDETANNGQGFLFFSELSFSPYARPDDIAYFNSFWAIDQFSSAARQTPGPLGRAGILFEPAGLGRYGAALAGLDLSPKARDLFGAVLGYQTFLGSKRRQLTLELGGRKDTNDIQQGAVAIGMRYQQAFGQRFVLRLDAFSTQHEERDAAYGGRMETLIRM